jgi:uncharacterized protein DUF3995
MTHPQGNSVGNSLNSPVKNGSIPDDSDPEKTLPGRPVWVYTAFVFTIAFTLLHVYWAAGGTWGVPLGALQRKAALQATNWVVSGITLIGACWVLALNHPLSRRVPSWMLLTPLWAGAVVCVSHSVYGFITKSLYLGGVHGAVDFPHVSGVSAATTAARHHLSAVQDLLVFEPCFAIQGILLALAAWQFIQTGKGRRWWWGSLIVSTVIVDVFGTLLALAGLHFAID